MSERTEQTARIQPRRKAPKVQSEAIAKHWIFLTAWYDAKRTEQTARRLDAAARATRIIDCSLAGNDVTAALDDANQQAETFEEKQRRYAEKHVPCIVNNKVSIPTISDCRLLKPYAVRFGETERNTTTHLN